MALNIFDMLNEVCEYKSDLDFDNPEINKAYDIYMINKYLSSIDVFVPVIDAVNRTGIDKKTHYEFLRCMIRKSKYHFNFIKKTENDFYNENIQYLCRYFEIGVREAKMYIEHLKPKQLEELRSLYSYGKNGSKDSSGFDE